MADKPLVWVGGARRDIRAFPADARSVAGFELRRVQLGLDPTDWKPLPGVGPGVREIRVQTGRAHRIFYVATFAEAVYVLHVFEKKPRRRRREILPRGVTGSERLRREAHMTPKPARLTRSSGNVFQDAGFPHEQAEHLQIRADLMIQIQKVVASHGLTQSEVAKVLRVSQPRVSDLLRGRIDLFSTDALINMLGRLGVGVRLVTKAKPRRVA